jgi:hypothetical protein
MTRQIVVPAQAGTQVHWYATSHDIGSRLAALARDDVSVPDRARTSGAALSDGCVT